MARGLDFDLGSGHTAYHHASLVDLYRYSKFFSDRKKLWTDGRADGHLRPTSLSRLGGVDLKINTNNTKTRFSRLLRHPAWKRSGMILVEWEGMEKQENRGSE